MELKGLLDYDCVNYKVPCLTLMFPKCDFKCDKLNGESVCQNCTLALEKNIKVSTDVIYEYYLKNPLTKAFCLQGLEPFDSFDDVLYLVFSIRKEYDCQDPIIIYTGYYPEEVPEYIKELKRYPNIIVKWGRFILDSTPVFDEILGVTLASNNQYGEKIS